MILVFYFVLISLFNRCIFGDSEKLTLYWNVPTHLCRKYGYDFENLLVPNKFKVNTEDKFQGDKIVVFRDPGLFPQTKQHKNGVHYCVNNCLPHQGSNLSLHLDKFYKDMEKIIPDRNYNGLAVIMFDGWDPLFANNNWGDKKWHKTIALTLEDAHNPGVTKEELDKLAEEKFDSYAKLFIEKTLNFGQEYRPHAKWGYYNYPKCSNEDNDNSTKCSQLISNGNDKLLWLFDASNALFPTLNYQLSQAVTKRVYLYPIPKLEAQLQETKRLVHKTERKPKVYPYLSLKFIDDELYLSQIDLDRALSKIREMDVADGVIMWLKEEDLDSEKKCEIFYNLTSEYYLPRLKLIGVIPSGGVEKVGAHGGIVIIGPPIPKRI